MGGAAAGATSDVVSFDGVASVLAGDVLLVLWQAPVRIARVHWLTAEMERATAASPSGLLVLMLILPTSNPPDAECRAIAKETMLRLSKKLRLTVTVPLGDAFWTNIVRTIMRGMMLITGQSATQQVVASEREGLERIRQAGSASTPPTAHLSSLIDALFLRLDEPRAQPGPR
jgi:hypothetical protein